ncbi:MAG: hypothetical protein BWX86_01346 [Verrucomicrobia bacterium ADurb.Bin122]|nr:MAG: hypothetical protein BWX86_01346 [Verrucomicrobia bacterium ADurb.Bin122]
MIKVESPVPATLRADSAIRLLRTTVSVASTDATEGATMLPSKHRY